MTNPRHVFILLGILAQGLTWDSYLFLGVVTVFWAFAVTFLKGRSRATLTSEAIALVAGCAISFAFSKYFQRSAHFFLGDGLILLQLVRLTRTLTGREKLTALIIAAFHFGVLCTLAPNIRFVMLFTGALFVLPGALKETFVESTLKTISPPEFKYRLVPTARVAFWLLLGSGFVFIAAPRFTGTPLQLTEGFTDQGSLLDSVLDPRRGGRANSQQVLLTIEGDRINYLRCFALTEFDGTKWWADKNSRLTPYFNSVEGDFREDPRYVHRRVHVKNSQFLGKLVPVDGVPVFMKANFFMRPGRSPVSGAIEPNGMWTTGNNVYEYYIDTQAEPEPLRPDVRRRLLYLPPQSDRLQQWISEVTTKGTNALERSRLLELHLRNQFTYELGTPELKRIGAIDDFVFNRREGHCERFAAAMALFLRMQGIPSRVVVGYVATTRNLFTGRLQARFRDAHSWTEGYFDGLGWMTFDATPGPPPSGSGSDIRDMFEAMDFAWYSHVVNFNGFAQRELFSGPAKMLSSVQGSTWDKLTWSMVALLIGAAGAQFMKGRKLPFSWFRRRFKTPAAVARNNYDRMLQIVEAQGLKRRDEITPMEFLSDIHREARSSHADAQSVTETFCRSYYGGKTVSDSEERATEEALDRLKEQGLKKRREREPV